MFSERQHKSKRSAEINLRPAWTPPREAAWAVLHSMRWQQFVCPIYAKSADQYGYYYNHRLATKVGHDAVYKHPKNVQAPKVLHEGRIASIGDAPPPPIFLFQRDETCTSSCIRAQISSRLTVCLLGLNFLPQDSFYLGAPIEMLNGGQEIQSTGPDQQPESE